MAHKYHPDMKLQSKKASTERFIKVQKAYDRILELDLESEGRLFKNKNQWNQRKEWTKEELELLERQK